MAIYDLITLSLNQVIEWVWVIIQGLKYHFRAIYPLFFIGTAVAVFLFISRFIKQKLL